MSPLAHADRFYNSDHAVPTRLVYTAMFMYTASSNSMIYIPMMLWGRTHHIWRKWYLLRPALGILFEPEASWLLMKRCTHASIWAGLTVRVTETNRRFRETFSLTVRSH